MCVEDCTYNSVIMDCFFRAEKSRLVEMMVWLRKNLWKEQRVSLDVRNKFYLRIVVKHVCNTEETKKADANRWLKSITYMAISIYFLLW